MRFPVLLTFALLFVAPSSRADEVRTHDGDRHTGTIKSITPTAVTFGGSVRDTVVPVNEIAAVVFTQEPRGLAEARAAYEAGRYTDVFTSLNEIKPEQLRREEVKTEIEFYRAMAAARLAGFGAVDQKTATAAGKDLIKFLGDHKDSHHFYEVNEALGDLLAALKNASAFRYYEVFASAPWPDYQVRAHLLKGRAEQMHGNHPAAIEHYNLALATPASGRPAELQMQFARIGKATSFIETGKLDEARQLLSEVIAKAAEGDREVFARAYNALAGAHRKAGATTDALLEYLKVELLYNTVPEAHAEALYYLSQLWPQARHPDRAKAAAATLQDRYPTSRWNRR
jgi:tetratricopeptide (TPR) repeat protein